jgi:hypothetical protein
MNCERCENLRFGLSKEIVHAMNAFNMEFICIACKEKFMNCERRRKGG